MFFVVPGTSQWCLYFFSHFVSLSVRLVLLSFFSINLFSSLHDPITPPFQFMTGICFLFFLPSVYFRLPSVLSVLFFSTNKASASFCAGFLSYHAPPERSFVGLSRTALQAASSTIIRFKCLLVATKRVPNTASVATTLCFFLQCSNRRCSI
jgi:hypothetical protein